MLLNSRLPLKKVLQTLNLSLEDYFKYVSILFPIIYENKIITDIKKLGYLDLYEVDFSYLDFSKTKYTLRCGPNFELSYYDNNVYYILKEDVKHQYINFISEYPQDTNIVSSVSMWKSIIEKDNLENRNLLKLLKDILFTIQSYYEIWSYEYNHYQYNHNLFLKSSLDYYKFDLNKLKLEHNNSVENIYYKLLDVNLDDLLVIHKKYQSIKNKSSKPTEHNTMSKSDTISNVVDTNKAALITATKLEVGNLALDLITEQFLKTLPEPLRVMVTNNPASKILIANLVNLLVSNTNIQDQRLLIVNESMMTVSYMEFFKTFDIQNILNNIVNQIPTNKLDTLKEDK